MRVIFSLNKYITKRILHHEQLIWILWISTTRVPDIPSFSIHKTEIDNRLDMLFKWYCAAALMAAKHYSSYTKLSLKMQPTCNSSASREMLQAFACDDRDLLVNYIWENHNYVSPIFEYCNFSRLPESKTSFRCTCTQNELLDVIWSVNSTTIHCLFSQWVALNEMAC